MTTHEWLETARAQAAPLRELLRAYHPVQPKRLPIGRITAPATEVACEQVRQNIRENFEGDPIVLFDEALAAGDISKISNLLNDAWFGVPESTACWQVQGFREAVALLDDPPEDDERG